jgi:YggT family protein
MDIVLVPLLHVSIAVIDLYKWFIIVHVIVSLLVNFNVVDGYNRFVYTIQTFLYGVTSPVLGRIQRLLPSFGGFDLSPMVAILALAFLQDVLVRISLRFVS